MNPKWLLYNEKQNFNSLANKLYRVWEVTDDLVLLFIHAFALSMNPTTAFGALDHPEKNQLYHSERKFNAQGPIAESRAPLVLKYNHKIIFLKLVASSGLY